MGDEHIDGTVADDLVCDLATRTVRVPGPGDNAHACILLVM